MSKRRRGMSQKEKCDTMLRLLSESGECYLLKELEKMGGKAGVVPQSVKETMQMLEDENLVKMEKVGLSNLYWSFPADSLNQARRRKATFEEKAAAAKERAEQMEEKLEKNSEGKDESEERSAKLARLGELEEKHAALVERAEMLKANDPEVVKELQRLVEVGKEAARRWTDNTWQLKTTMVQKFGVDPREAERMLRMSAEFDYPAGCE